MTTTAKDLRAPYIDSGAVISSCAQYRYRLWREWRGTPNAQWDMWTREDGSPALDGGGHQIGEPLSCVFVMLNPSTADEQQDDPTIRRCVGFAKRFGFDRMEVINLFAYRATKPADLFNVSHERNPVGPDNSRHVARALDAAGMIICAWGAHGDHIGQNETMLGWLDQHNHRGAPIVALGLTKDGHPRHPLYLRSDAEPVPFGSKTMATAINYLRDNIDKLEAMEARDG